MREHYSLHKKSHYKVAIIGGGPAGCACALALAQAGLTENIIIEASDYSQFRIGESIPPEALKLLQTLNVDRAFLQDKHLPCYGTRSFWGDNRPGYNDTAINPFGNGWHLDRNRFDKFLLEQAKDRGVSVLLNTRFVTAAADGDGYVLNLKNIAEPPQTSQQLRADFVIDATGVRSSFARQQGSRQQQAFSLVAMVARFRHEGKISETYGLTHIDATAHGWWYSAQLPDNNLLVAFYSDPVTVKNLGLKRTERWMELLSSSPNSAHLFPLACNSNTQVMAFSAPSFCLDQLSGGSWLAIGDAASSWDPIASQGIVKAISSGISAAKFLTGALNKQQLTGSVQQTHQRYMALREQFYRLEQRWPESSFWQRQQHWHETESNIFNRST